MADVALADQLEKALQGLLRRAGKLSWGMHPAVFPAFPEVRKAQAALDAAAKARAKEEERATPNGYITGAASAQELREQREWMARLLRLYLELHEGKPDRALQDEVRKALLKAGVSLPKGDRDPSAEDMGESVLGESPGGDR